jgi:hypothetical protein
MTAISCPFPSRRCETSTSSLKEPSAFNPSGTCFWTSLQCVSATRTMHFVYATCYLCLGHVCYLCLGLGPSRKIQTLSQGDWSSPDEGTSLGPRRAEPWCSAGPRLGAFIDLTVSNNRCGSIFSGETSWSFGSLAPPLGRQPHLSLLTNHKLLHQWKKRLRQRGADGNNRHVDDLMNP